jgi:hypothetical protein
MARIVPSTPIYQRGQPRPSAQRRPRLRDRAHLERIARMPCAVPGCRSSRIQVAHVRFACAIEGAAIVGKAEKPDDWRVLPLCVFHHMEGPEAQHRMNEALFWARHGINPYSLARALYNLSGDYEAMQFLLARAPVIFPDRAAYEI